MNTAFDEALRLLEYAREEIQNCYGEDTDLTDRITCFLGFYEMNLKRSIGGKGMNDCENCQKHNARTGKCKVFLTPPNECWAFTADPNWAEKVRKETEYYRKYIYSGGSR